MQSLMIILVEKVEIKYKALNLKSLESMTQGTGKDSHAVEQIMAEDLAEYAQDKQ